MCHKSKKEILGLDSKINSGQLELNQIKHINSEIVKNELPQLGSLMFDLVQILAEINLLRDKLADSRK